MSILQELSGICSRTGHDWAPLCGRCGYALRYDHQACGTTVEGPPVPSLDVCCRCGIKRRHQSEGERIREAEAKAAEQKVEEAKAAEAKAAAAVIKERQLAFFSATRNGDLESVERMLNDNPDLLISKDEHDNRPLHLAVEGDHKAVVELLLLKGKSDVNVKARNGNKPLHLAAVGGHKDVTELLLLKKADVNAVNNKGYTPLHLAAEGGHKAVVELLLLKKADVNAVTNKGLTPLRLAVLAGNQDMAELLLLHGGRE
ncbi:MAG: ankyrin repeat domain-containing protein [Verrucomicrobiota bacterium]